MGASSRPHRQARSGLSYKDSFSDDDDFSKARKASTVPQDPARKNLALKRASRSRERANAKERAEAVQLQRAINESLAKDSTEAKRTSSESSERSGHTEEVVDSEDEAANATHNGSVAFQCLLDVVSEAGSRVAGTSNETEAAMVSEQDIEKQLEVTEALVPLNGRSQDPDLSEQTAVCKDDKKDEICEDDEWSFEAEEEDDHTEDDSSDVSEDSPCKMKRVRNSQQKGQPRLKKEKKENPFTGPVKKARSTRCVSKGRTCLAANSSSFSSSVGQVMETQPVKAPHGKENTLPSQTPPAMTRKAVRSHVLTCSKTKDTNDAIRTNSCRIAAVQTPWKGNRVPLIDNASCESPGAISFQAQSPTLIHRRVIGLSRRFRPPPLHPYLSKTDG